MTKKSLFIIIAIVIIVVVITFLKINKKEKNSNQNQPIEATYREKVDNSTGSTVYEIYDKNTGRVIANTTVESDVQLYLDNPDFQGTQVDEQSAIDDPNIHSGSVWEN